MNSGTLVILIGESKVFGEFEAEESHRKGDLQPTNESMIFQTHQRRSAPVEEKYLKRKIKPNGPFKNWPNHLLFSIYPFLCVRSR